MKFTITINAPASQVRNTMLNHPTYEQWTLAFSEGSSYEGSWEKGSDIKFGSPSGEGMIATIAENRLHEYISIQHLGEMMINKASGKLETKMYDGAGFENYTFTKLSETQTKLDIEITAKMPPEYVDMFNDMWPKALQSLKNLCEQQ